MNWGLHVYRHCVACMCHVTLIKLDIMLISGSLNVDLNEIVMNLVPFPSLHYLVTSQTPLYTQADVNIPLRRLDQMFTDAFSPDHQLIKADPKHSMYLACALMVRGNVQISDIRRNIERWILIKSFMLIKTLVGSWKTNVNYCWLEFSKG